MLKSLLKLLVYCIATFYFMYITITEILLMTADPTPISKSWIYRLAMIICIFYLYRILARFILSLGIPKTPIKQPSIMELHDIGINAVKQRLQFYNTAVIMSNDPTDIEIYAKEITKLKRELELFEQLKPIYKEINELEPYSPIPKKS